MVDYYDLDNKLIHTVVGQTLPILKPVEEICSVDAWFSTKYLVYITYDGVTILGILSDALSA